MGRFFNEIMKGKKFIPAKMEALRQEFRSRPPCEEPPVLTVKEIRQANLAKARAKAKANREAARGQVASS